MDILISTLFLIVCVLLVIIVLLQKGRGGGLSAALGGGMGSHSAFGSRTGDVFTWVTIILVAVFLLLAVVATQHFRPSGNEQVEAPILTPGPRPLDRPMTVSINVPGATGDEKIFYTLDGSTPTGRSLLYDAPSRVSPGQTLKAMATRRGWRPSNVTSGEYAIAGATRPSSAPSSGPASLPAESRPAAAH